MSTKAHITSDFPTPDDIASRLRIAPSRAAELRQRLLELHVTRPDGTVVHMQMKRTPRPTARKSGATARAKKK
jgi:hypothetical protein